jgi:hypothetical protein
VVYLSIGSHDVEAWRRGWFWQGVEDDVRPGRKKERVYVEAELSGESKEGKGLG